MRSASGICVRSSARRSCSTVWPAPEEFTEARIALRRMEYRVRVHDPGPRGAPVEDVQRAESALEDLLADDLLRIKGFLDVDTVAVLLLDENEDVLVARAASGLEEEVEQGVRIPVGKGFAGRVAATQSPVVIEDVDQADVLNPI